MTPLRSFAMHSFLEEAHHPQGWTQKTPPKQPLTVLIVEDDPIPLALYRRIMERNGYTVITALEMSLEKVS